MAAAGQAEAAIGEIDSEITRRAEDAHPALGAGGDATSGNAGDGTRGEANAGIGDVLLVTGDGRTDSIDAFDLAVGQRQDQVEVVDHEIEHDGNIGAACFECAGAGGFQVERAAGAGDKGRVGGGEALEMADLENGAIVARELSEVIRISQCGSDGFLDQDVAAGAEGLAGDGVVRVGGDRDDKGLRGGDQIGEGEGGGSGFTGEGGGMARIVVVNAGEGGAGGGDNFKSVVAAEVAGADEADAEAGWHGWGCGGRSIAGQGVRLRFWLAGLAGIGDKASG